jgi:GTPase SAR1 family protein
MPTYKVFLVGDEQTGKTSFIERITDGNFNENYTKSELVNSYVHIFYKDTFILFDIASDDISTIETCSCDAVIIFCDNRKETINNIFGWYRLVKIKSPNVKIIIVQNKIDLNIEKDLIDKTSGILNGCTTYISVKLDKNIENVFIMLSCQLKPKLKVKYEYFLEYFYERKM